MALEVFDVPPTVAKAAWTRWPARGEQWRKSAPQELHKLCEKYGAQPVKVFSHARYGFVVAAKTHHEGLVMRGTPDPAGPQQAQVAEALAMLGVGPRIHEVSESPAGTWTVMDHVKPGQPLSELEISRAVVDQVAQTLGCLVNQPAPPQLPNLTEWLHRRLTENNLVDTPMGHGTPSHYERNRACSVLSELSNDSHTRLCHADASEWNVLRSGINRFMLIDPRGLAGDLAYDIAVIAYKLGSSHDTETVAERLAQECELSIERVRAWLVIVAAAQV